MDLQLREGWIEPELAEEFPELHLTYTPVGVGVRAEPAGPQAAAAATSPIATPAPRSCRCASRRCPGPTACSRARSASTPTRSARRPSASASSGCCTAASRAATCLDDALTIAVAETSVPVIALDGDRCGAELGLRLARSGERLDARRLLSERQIVVADRERPLAMVLGDISEDAGVTPECRAHGAGRAAGQGRAAHQRRGGALDRGRDPARSLTNRCERGPTTGMVATVDRPGGTCPTSCG